VLADDRDPVDAEHPLDLGAGATAHARDEGVPARQARDLAPRLVGDTRVLGPLDDRRERPVDVEEDRRAAGFVGEHAERVVRHGPTLGYERCSRGSP
jgi:hypothetical protein